MIPIWAALALVISSPLILISFPIHLSILLLVALALLTLGSIPTSLAMLKGRENISGSEP